MSGYTEILDISPYRDATCAVPLRLPLRRDAPILTANDKEAVAMLLASRNPQGYGRRGYLSRVLVAMPSSVV